MTPRLTRRPPPATALGPRRLLAKRRGRASAPRDVAALCGPLVGVGFLGGVAAALARSEVPYPRPGADPSQIQRYFGQPSGAPRLSAAGQLASAASLAGFTASAARLAARSERAPRALRAATIAGGSLAAVSLGASAAGAAALAGRRERSVADTVALHRRMFLAGGPVHGVGFGLLIGGLGLAGLDTGELPRALALAGVLAAAPNLLSPASVIAEPAAWLIPAGRFPGLVVAAIAGARLGGLVG